MWKYLKNEIVLTVSWALALVSMFFVHPNVGYVKYIDGKTLALLFCLMLLVKGFQKVGLFDFLIQKIFGKVKSSRRLSQVLILLCFFLSMLITNDVALLTFVPFAIYALQLCGQEKQMICVIVLQTIAANLGSMFTPIGNPQNLYLFSVSNMEWNEFFGTMFPLTAISFVLLLVATWMIIPDKEIKIDAEKTKTNLNKKELTVYSILFLINLLVVFRLVSWIPVLLLTVIIILQMRKGELLREVDYALLFTFVGFFLFVGNIGQIQWVREMLRQMLKGRELILAVGFSQFLSNVPTTLLLSGFTENYKELLLGANIGGLGTLIASMASLISYKLYAQTERAQKGKYILTFTVYNVIGLLILLAFTYVS